MKFTLCIDYKVATGKGLEYIQMNATKILDAISEADEMWNDEIFMMQIMEKEGKTERADASVSQCIAPFLQEEATAGI